MVRGVKMSERRITKIGNSLGVTFPSELLSQLDLNQGDEVTLVVENNSLIIRKSRKVNLPNGISEDFFDVVNESFENYGKTIKNLADR